MGKQSPFYEIARQAVLEPQEVMVQKTNSKSKFTIGIPKEDSFQENRIGLTPQAVQLLTFNGYEVIVESKAGEEAKFKDDDYTEAGATISYQKEPVYQADIVVKVSFPTLEEIGLMANGKTIISALHFPLLKREYIQALQHKKITALGYEYLKDESGGYPIIQSMSEIAGNTCVLIAAEYLSNINHGKGVMLGGISGIPPSEVVILGAGTVGQFACQTALGLGADVKIFDNSVLRLRRLQNTLGMRIYTSIVHPNILTKALRTADVVIGAIRSENGRTPHIVTEEMVMNMKKGSVIIDVSIDQGGCVETSEVTDHANPIFEKYDVIHYCVPNIPSRVARTASYCLSNIFAPMLIDVKEAGGIQDYLWEKEGVRSGVYIYKGNLTNQAIGERFGLKYKEINLLIAARV